MDLQSNEIYYCYDKINEFFVVASNEEFIKDFGIDDSENHIQEYQKLIRIPSKIEIQEFNIMKNFASTIKNKNISSVLLNALSGSGAYKKFLSNIKNYGLEKEWLEFRFIAFKKIAINWCKKNELMYEE